MTTSKLCQLCGTSDRFQNGNCKACSKVYASAYRAGFRAGMIAEKQSAVATTRHNLLQVLASIGEDEVIVMKSKIAGWLAFSSRS